MINDKPPCPNTIHNNRLQRKQQQKSKSILTKNNQHKNEQKISKSNE